MDSLVLHTATKHLFDAYMRTPTQSVLLSGPMGIGARTVANAIAAGLRARPDDIHLIQPDEKGTIPIELIRGLYTLTRTVYDSPRVVIIDDAESMSLAAQNALLKLLEEPTERTYFILTSHQPQLLLATIRSRAQQIELRPVSIQQCQQLLQRYKLSAEDQKRLLFIAPGLPAELIRLATDRNYFDAQAALVNTARTVLQAEQYERLIITKDYKDRTQAVQLVVMIGRLLEFSVLNQFRADLASALELIEEVHGNLSANGNVRIQLDYLVTKLP